MNPSHTHTLPNAADKAALQTIAATVVASCPGLQDSAHQVASDLLTRQGLSDLDPDHVYFHRFKAAKSSSTSFTGWEHSLHKPYESQTLTQLVIHRFRATDQDNADLLDVWGGFYTAGPQEEEFNQTNEVRLHGNEVLRAFWAVDFSTLYTDHLNAFWSEHADDFRTLAKCQFLIKAVEARDKQQLSEEDLAFVVNALMAPMSWPVNLQTLQQTQEAGSEVRAFDIAGHVATNVLRIVDPKGRQIVYLPGEAQPLRVFETEADLHWWVLGQMNDETSRQSFLTHFPLADRQEITDNLTDLMNRLVSTWGKAEHHLINQKNQAVSADAFTWLMDMTRNSMNAEASLSLTSNGDLRKKLWVGYLSAGLKVFGPMAIIGWPVALPLLGASIASLGLNIDQAVSGKTSAERKAGVIGAVIAGLDTLFNLLSLNGPKVLAETGPDIDAALAAEDAELAEATSNPKGEPSDPEEDAAPAIPEVIAPVPAEPTIHPVVPDAWQANELLEGETLVTEPGKYNGIYKLRSNPSTAIMMNDMAYYVRYEKDLNGPDYWAIFDPQKPDAWSPSIPVRLNAEGNWETLPRSGLKGGGKPATIANELSPAPGASSTAPQPYSAYEVPSQFRARLNRAAQGFEERSLMDITDTLDEVDPYREFKALRKRLYQDAQVFFAKPALPPRPPIPQMHPQTEGYDILKRIFNNARGLVVGESHADIGSKQFLIENMGWLARNNVKTLYMEHLFTDFHQVDLDLFGKTGLMSKGLELDLARLDAGHITDPLERYNFLELVRAAQRHGVRVQAIDCMASYRLGGMELFTPEGGRLLDPLARQKMMNFYARGVIRADQASRGVHKWVALVGNTHSNTFQGVPGVSEMEEAIGVRVVDVAEGQSAGIVADPGEQLATSQLERTQQLVKGDLRLQIETPWAAQRTSEIKDLLPRQGMYTLVQEPRATYLVHRSKDGSLVRTAIENDSGRFSIERTNWPTISGQRFNSIPALLKTLDRMGMKLAGWSRPLL
ncbi:membrane-targeted effector domain-containing toxin [Pseudomonas vancouverensis]|uniref:Toxin n=1 Tax=Pseudomonas vancouverensis TaxID=95300 RepID=A0A1H2M476_PSEVA|nr:membrane-targeted effector domain-containing toxin [Pseudomonas vancouverensis]KAB0498774.1 toxin [Pseudomonas vancouverensis]TDB57471.1 toxin [Pseudomonas vancouverensis]SDU88053.1 hypothetical protein SAMN05216558_0229 [Pseudomonas vancouverensis]